MYYEEKIINGRMFWRGTPHGEWVEMSPEMLVEEIERLREEVASLQLCLRSRLLTPDNEEARK